jgi:hypothetical protein
MVDGNEETLGIDGLNLESELLFWFIPFETMGPSLRSPIRTILKQLFHNLERDDSNCRNESI